MRLIKFGKRRIAAVGLFLVMSCGGMVLYKLIEAYSYSNLEKNLANQLIASSELIRLRALGGSQNWDQLLENTVHSEATIGEKFDYLFLVNNKVQASSLNVDQIEIIKNLNLQKMAFLNQAFVREDMMLRSSLIRHQESGDFAHLVLSYQLKDLNRLLFFYQIGLLLFFAVTIYGINRAANAYWKKQIVPLYYLRDRVKDVIRIAGFFSKDQIEKGELVQIPNYLSKSVDHLLHREQVAKDQVQKLEMEWENFFRGLSLAAIKLQKHEGKLVGAWGASEHLKEIIAPVVLDSQNPIESLFGSSFEFATSVAQIESEILSCYEQESDQIAEIAANLPREASMILGHEDKKIFFSWIPCLDKGNFVAMLLELSDVCPYGQGQEVKQLRQIEYEIALDAFRSGSSIFMVTLDKIKSLNNEIIETTEKEQAGVQMQLKIKALIMEIRATLLESKQDTLSAQFTKLILEMLPVEAFNEIPDGSEKYDWAQLSPIVRYIVKLASTVAEAANVTSDRMRKFRFNYANLDSLVLKSTEVNTKADL